MERFRCGSGSETAPPPSATRQSLAIRRRELFDRPSLSNLMCSKMVARHCGSLLGVRRGREESVAVALGCDGPTQRSTSNQKTNAQNRKKASEHQQDHTAWFHAGSLSTRFALDAQPGRLYRAKAEPVGPRERRPRSRSLSGSGFLQPCPISTVGGIHLIDEVVMVPENDVAFYFRSGCQLPARCGK